MATLNLANFTTVLDDDFTKDHSLNTNIWSAHWGNTNQYWFTGTSNGLMLSGSAAANWNPVGFEQAPWSKSTGEGYGLFSFKGFAGQAGQGVGICFVLWPADNVWLPSNKPGLSSEIDILESWDGTKNGYSTLHYYQPGSNNNGQEIHQLKVDLTVSHTYAMDWEAGSLTFYIDGQQIYQNTSHVPLDFAHGGVNESMGAEVVNGAALVTTPTVQFYVQDISYSTANAGSVVTPPAPTPSSITLSAPGTLQEASAGAGVTVTETVSATGMTALYAEVLTKAGAVESSWQTVSLDATGHASFTAHLAQSGDTIRAVDSTTSPTVTTNSTPVTITEPVATGSVLLGQSAAGPLSFSVLDSSRGGKRILELDVIKTVGNKATLREFIDHRYYGTLRDGLADGSFTIRTSALAAGAHSILLTLDGSTATATAAFTVPALKAAATSVAGQVQADVTSPARLATVLSIPTASGSSAAILPDTTGGSAAQLLAMAASSASTTLLHANT